MEQNDGNSVFEAGAVRRAPQVIGLTGGIGAGKTTVCRIFESLGVPVWSADDAAKRCYVEDVELRGSVVARFGPAVFVAGELDREALAKLVFEDAAALEDLNALVHPAVARSFSSWRAGRDAPYVIREAAILFESGSNADCAAVVVVTAPEAVRLARATSRDGLTQEAVRTRMAHQWPESQLIERADHLVDSGGRLPLVPQVVQIHEELLALVSK
ncbi:MAG: dephospho-CoA kinase [Flavobacteriales bacterium]|nr:dephospho-CoA kinase [Flavobacteriales bacterium]